MKKHEMILIVDDETMFRKFVIRVLEDSGYTCFEAENTEQALATLKKNAIDLCLLDIKMPDKTGDQFLKEFRSCYPEVAVIMSTGVNSADMATSCRALGADDYLVKPFDPERLLISVQNVLERRALLREKKFYRQQLEQKLAAQAQQLRASQSVMVQQEKLAAIGQLAAGVAHEINNPLGYISGNLNALKKYLQRLADYQAGLDDFCRALPEEKQKEHRELKRGHKIDAILDDLPDLVSDSLEGTSRIKAIVQSLKSFSRTDEDKPVAVDLNECLENAITVVWNEIKYNSELERDFADLPSIQGYPQQLAQVFMNLLVNASHAIEEKGLIQIKTFVENDQLVVTVKDNGCGIAPDHLQKIFDPFFTTKPTGKGTGLGMSIASDILHKHGGTIEVASKVGEGTTFTVKLPNKNVSAADNRIDAA